MATVELQDLTKSFGPVEVLHNLNLRVEEGEFVALVGPSGCGKSTLLRIVAGLEETTDGDVLIDGEWVNDLTPRERNIAMVFQSYALYPHMNVEENIGFNLRVSGLSRPEIRKRVHETADILDLGALLHRKPSQLSGGQRQRVAMGRALVRNPDAFLFDEPLSNLDAKLRVQMREEIKRLHQKVRTTSIYVTHDQIEAMTLADRVVILDKGRIQQIGTPTELYRHPANAFVAGFIGSPSMNFMTGRLTTANGTATVAMPGGTVLELSAAGDLPPLGEVVVGLRPEHLTVGQAGDGDNQFTGQVELIEPTGAQNHLKIGVGGESLTVVDGTLTELTIGQTVGLGVAAANIHLFPWGSKPEN